MENRPISDLMETAMQKMRELIDANTIVGEAITTADGITMIPVSKLSFGFIGGGSDIPQKQDKNGFGGGTGAGVHITPVAFIIVKGTDVDILYVTPTAMTSVDRIIEAVPDVIDKITDFMGKDKDKENQS